MPTSTDTPQPPWTEEEKLWKWRYIAAGLAGCGNMQAQILAERGVHADDIRALAEKGCPPDILFDLLT